jgi:hypothetical protein
MSLVSKFSEGCALLARIGAEPAMMRAMAEARWGVQVQSRPEKVGSRLLLLRAKGSERSSPTPKPSSVGKTT